MITPKNQKEFSSCSRGCRKCNDNLADWVHVNVSPDNPFYFQLKEFFSKNELVNNQEVTFLYYWDFSRDFNTVQQGIRNLFDFEIIPTDSNIWVWMRCDNHLTQDAFKYIENWQWPWELRIKFSLDLSRHLLECIQSIKIFFQSVNKISPIISSKIIMMLQMNNIEHCKLSLAHKKILFSLLKSLKRQFPFLNIQFSDFIVNINLDIDFQDDFFSYEAYKKCIYLDEKVVGCTLERNFLSDTDIFIEHVDIFQDAIAIHNLHCKKLLMNNFWSIQDSISNINARIRKFCNHISQLENNFNGQGNICDFCKKSNVWIILT